MNVNSIFPLRTKVLIKPNDVETTTSFGLVISGGDMGDYRTADVLAAGGKCDYVKAGQTVIVNWNKVLDVKVEGKLYCIVDEEDVLAIVG